MPLFDRFRYEVDLTYGGVFGSVGLAAHSGAINSDQQERRPEIAAPGRDLLVDSRERGIENEDADRSDARAGLEDKEHRPIVTDETFSSVSYKPAKEEDEGGIYSPAALSFVSPVLQVAWPLGVLLPTDALRTYAIIHRALFRHQLALHRLRRLRLTLRELDVAMAGSKERRLGVGVAAAVQEERTQPGQAEGAATGIMGDLGRLHWMHLVRHEMQHMADSLQVHTY